MAVRGLTRFARPAGSPLTVFVVCPTGCASCRTPVGASHPHRCNMRKSSHFRTSSSLNMAVRGLTRFARPAGSPLTVFVVCPTGCASCRTRSGLLIPTVQYAKKLALSYELFFKYGGEGIDSLRSPCGQPTHCVRGLSNWLRQLSNPVGASHPHECNMRKSSHFRTSFSLNMAVRGFEPRYVAVYTLSGVLLQPLGHLTKLFCYQTSWVATGRYYRELE